MTIEEIFILNFLAIQGLHIVTRHGYLFGFVERWASRLAWTKEMNRLTVDYSNRVDGWEYLEEDFKFYQNWVIKKHLEPRPFKNHYWMKAVSECPTCMSSLWSLPGFLYSDWAWYSWPVYACILAGINAIYAHITRDKIIEQADKYDADSGVD